MNIFSYIQKRNVSWKIKLLAPYFDKRESVLDFGCGDLSLARELKKFNKNLLITGVDVANLRGKRYKNPITYVQYKGDTLPFKNNSFDTVLAFYVFHHCDDLQTSFEECLRVARKRIIVVESIPRTEWEVPIMKLLDYAFNMWKKERISPPNKFLRITRVKKTAKKYNATVKTQTFGNPLIFGKQYLFEITKR